MNAQLLRIAAIISALSVVACSPGKQQVHSAAPAYPELKPIQSSSKLPDIATKPDGGVDPNRVIPLSPEENMARVRKNIVEPVIFGKSAAGISITTTFAQSLNILSNPIGSSKSQLFYNEAVSIVWKQGEPELFEAMIVFDEYKGVVQLPAKFNSPTMGTSFATYFTETAPAVPGTALIKELARYFENKPESYDCFAEDDCEISVDDSDIDFTFRNGFLRFSNDADKKLSIIYFGQPAQPKTPAITAPIVFNESAGGVKLDWTLAQVKALLGEPIKVIDNKKYVYDNGNLIVTIQNDKVVVLQVQGKFKGKLTLPAELGDIALGTELKSHFTEADPKGEEFLRKIARFMDKKDATYDCFKEDTCGIQEGGDLIQMAFTGGLLAIEKNETKKLSIVLVGH